MNPETQQETSIQNLVGQQRVSDFPVGKVGVTESSRQKRDQAECGGGRRRWQTEAWVLTF